MADDKWICKKFRHLRRVSTPEFLPRPSRTPRPNRPGSRRFWVRYTTESRAPATVKRSAARTRGPVADHSYSARPAPKSSTPVSEPSAGPLQAVAANGLGQLQATRVSAWLFSGPPNSCLGKTTGHQRGPSFPLRQSATTLCRMPPVNLDRPDCDRVHISRFCCGDYVAPLFKKSTAVI